MTKRIAFLFSGTVESSANEALLSVIDALDKSKFQAGAIVRKPKGDFARKLPKMTTIQYPNDKPFPSPEQGRISGMMRAFSHAMAAIRLIKVNKIDAIVSAEPGFLLAFAAVTGLQQKPLIWIQDTPWTKYRFATMWAGYVPAIYCTSEAVLNALPAELHNKAVLLKLPQNKAEAKKFADTIFKDCN